MTENLKCPYCNKTLHCGATLKSDKYLIDLYQCANAECESTEFLVGCKEFWDILGQLIRTHKALEIALDAIDKGEAALIGCQEADDKYISDVTAEDGLELMNKAYKQIKELDKESNKRM